MLSGNCTEALSIQANVTISGSSAKLIKNGIAPLPFPPRAVKREPREIHVKKSAPAATGPQNSLWPLCLSGEKYPREHGENPGHAGLMTSSAIAELDRPSSVACSDLLASFLNSLKDVTK